MVIKARTLEEEFGKQTPVQSHVQQGQNADSKLQALAKKVKQLEGMIKKRHTKAQLNQRKESLTCKECGLTGIFHLVV